MNIPKFIIIHHSLTADNLELSSYEAVKKYHINEKGMIDIAYHALIEYVNKTPVVQLGRADDTRGAHCIGMNERSIGVCFLGNFDLCEPDEAIYDTGAAYIAGKCLKYNIPLENIHPHYRYAIKTCPGRMFNMAKLVLKTEIELNKLKGGVL